MDRELNKGSNPHSINGNNSRPDIDRSKQDLSKSRLDKTIEIERPALSSRRSQKRNTNRLSQLYGPVVENYMAGSPGLSKKQSISGKQSVGGRSRKRSAEAGSGGVGTFNFDIHKLTIGDLKDLKWNDSKPVQSQKVIQKTQIVLDRAQLSMTLHANSGPMKTNDLDQSKSQVQVSDIRKDIEVIIPTAVMDKSPQYSPNRTKNTIKSSKKLKSEKAVLTKAKKVNTSWIRFVKSIEIMYSSIVFTICFASVIFLSMFMRDLWIIFFSGQTDKYCDIALGILFGFFLLESVLNSIVFKQYRFSFVFGLDTVSTLTLLLDFTNMPFVDSATYRTVKNSIAFRLMGLLSVLKLWRATRLFFRKNQTKTFLPINEMVMSDVKKTATVGGLMEKTMNIKKSATKMLQKSKTNRMIKGVFNDKPGFFKSIEEDALKGLKRPQPHPILEIPLAAQNNLQASNLAPGNIADASSKNTPQISLFLADDDIHKESVINEDDIDAKIESSNNHRLRDSHNSKLKDPTDNSIKFKDDIGSGIPGLKDDNSFLEVYSKSELCISNRSSKLDIVKSTVRGLGDEMTIIMKDKNAYNVKKKQKDFILRNKIEANGNIRKTIAYRNVGTIACTVLMTSLGLSIFVSTIYYDTTPICIYDADSVKNLLMVPENRTPAMMKTALNYLQNKYDQIKYNNIMEFTVGDLISYKDGYMADLRSEELYTCRDDFESDGKVYPITVILSNRLLMFYESLFNIMRTVFIVVILIYNILMNNRDIKFIIMDPIEHIYEESSQLTVFPLKIEEIFQKNSAYFESDMSLIETEWKIIAKLINFSANWLVNIFGTSAESYLVKAINYEDFELKTEQGEQLEGIFCYIDTTQLVDFLARLIEDENYIRPYNACLSLLHREVTLMRGEIYSKLPGSYVFAWFFNDKDLFDEPVSKNELANLRKKHMMAKAELAFTAIASALFKLRIFLRNYTYSKHDRLQFRMDGLVSLAMHSGWAIKGAVGGDNKVDMVLTSQCVTQTEELSKISPELGLDILFTEPFYRLLSPEVTFC